jgi:calcium/calmodulin-dependent protein kinase I
MLSTKLKLCDFGLSRRVPDVRFYKKTGSPHLVPFEKLCGTAGYIAPELLERKPYGIESDMWSVGVIAFEMLMGYRPFHPASACLTEELKFDERYSRHVSHSALDFVAGLLRRDPAKRMSARRALEHPWLQRAQELSGR